jgi:hypothetical protein
MNIRKRQPWPAAIASSAAVLVFLLAAGAPRTLADTFDFTSCDFSSGNCGTAPYGSVTLTQSGTSVDVTVALDSGIEFVKTGAGAGQAFLFDATGVSASDITITSPSGLTAHSGSFMADGTGDFTFGIECGGCSMGSSGAFAGPIDFTVDNAIISQLTIPNNNGNVFAADVLINGNTGDIDASPEPGAVTLVGIVLLAFFGLAVYSRSKATA